MAIQNLIFTYPSSFDYDEANIKIQSTHNNPCYWTLELYAEDAKSLNPTKTLIETIFTNKSHTSSTTFSYTPDIQKLTRYLKYGQYRYYFKSTTTSKTNSSDTVSEFKAVEITGYINQGDGIYIAPIVLDINPDTVALTGNPRKLVRHHSKILAYLTPHFTYGGVDLTKDVRENIYNGGVEAKENSQYYVAGYNSGYVLDKASSETTIFQYHYVQGWSGTSYPLPTTSIRTYSVVNEIVDYVNLTCKTLVGPVMEDGTTTLTIYGSVFNGSFGKITNKIMNISYQIIDEDGIIRESYGDFFYANEYLLDYDGNFYKLQTTITRLDPKKRYTFTATVKDQLMEVSSEVQTSSVSYGTPIFDWDDNDFKFNVDVSVQNGNFSVSNGEVRVQDGDMVIDHGNLTVNGDLTFNPSSSKFLPYYGTWTPKVYFDYLHQDIPQAEGDTDGWDFKGNYVKLGDMCLVNFYIRFTPLVTSGILESTFVIGGLPFDPDPSMPWQAGGGVIHNYRSQFGNDSTFDGWSIEQYQSLQGAFDSVPDGYYIHGRVSEFTPSFPTDISETKRPKRSGYLSAYFHTSKELIASGTILYKVANGA
jgi:hypothetical protein